MLPFIFLIFPGSQKALDRPDAWYDVVLFVATAAASFYLMLNIRKAAELGWEFGEPPAADHLGRLRDVVRADGGAAPDRRLEPAAERVSLHGLSAVRGTQWLGPLKGNQSTLDQTTAYHVLSTESLLGIPIQAFAESSSASWYSAPR